MDLRLQLHFDIQVQVQPESQLLVATSLFTLFTLFFLLSSAADDATHCLACAPRDTIYCVTRCVLNEVAGLVGAAEATERAAVAAGLLLAGASLLSGLAAWSALLLLLRLALHLGALDVFCV